MAESAPVPTLQEFIACCEAECEFLVRDYGFARLPTPTEYNPYSVCFRKEPLGVDVYGENWGATASCDLVRGGDRLYLGLLVPAQQRDTRKRKKARPGQLAQVQAIAQTLKLHADDFLRGDTARFDLALAEWKRITRPRKISDAQRLERQRQQALTAAGHASKRADHAEVVRLLEPYEAQLTTHQKKLLDMARSRLQKGD